MYHYRIVSYRITVLSCPVLSYVSLVASVCPSVSQSVCLPIYLSGCLVVSLSLFFSTRLSVPSSIPCRHAKVLPTKLPASRHVSDTTFIVQPNLINSFINKVWYACTCLSVCLDRILGTSSDYPKADPTSSDYPKANNYPKAILKLS